MENQSGSDGEFGQWTSNLQCGADGVVTQASRCILKSEDGNYNPIKEVAEM